MYQYDNYDQTIVDERVAQFRDQTQRYLEGQLSEDEYRPLRLMNGLYPLPVARFSVQLWCQIKKVSIRGARESDNVLANVNAGLYASFAVISLIPRA